jgi:heterodisulfide reductase subunit A-like polyferredoxin
MVSEVLIIGGGFAGLSSAFALSSRRIKCTVVERSDRVGGQLLTVGRLYQTGRDSREVVEDLERALHASSAVTISTESVLAGFSGAPGEFDVTISHGKTIRKSRFGAVIVTTGAALSLPPELQGSVILSSDGAKIAELAKTAACISFILAPQEYSTVVQTGSAIGWARKLREGGTEVFLLYDHLRVAGSAVETLYDSARNAGVIFARYEKMPTVKTKGEKRAVTFFERSLGSKIEILCDAVIEEGEIKSASDSQDLAALLDIDTDSDGFFQSENVSLFPVDTRRRGIFVVGACRQSAPIEEIASDASCAASQIAEMFESFTKGFQTERPVVDTDKCAFCLTCMRSCPHRAIGFDLENRATRVIDSACFSCGICAAECPARAIKFETKLVRV